MKFQPGDIVVADRSYHAWLGTTLMEEPELEIVISTTDKSVNCRGFQEDLDAYSLVTKAFSQSDVKVTTWRYVGNVDSQHYGEHVIVLMLRPLKLSDTWVDAVHYFSTRDGKDYLRIKNDFIRNFERVALKQLRQA